MRVRLLDLLLHVVFDKKKVKIRGSMQLRWMLTDKNSCILCYHCNPGAIPKFRTYRRVGLNVERNYKMSPVR